MRWVKNTKGFPDSMLTFALGGFVVVLVSIFASIVQGSTFEVFSQQFMVSTPDPTIVAALLGSTVLAYVNRRNTKDKLDHEITLKTMDKPPTPAVQPKASKKPLLG